LSATPKQKGRKFLRPFDLRRCRIRGKFYRND
jgi:hypothetical protein